MKNASHFSLLSLRLLALLYLFACGTEPGQFGTDLELADLPQPEETTVEQALDGEVWRTDAGVATTQLTVFGCDLTWEAHYTASILQQADGTIAPGRIHWYALYSTNSCEGGQRKRLDYRFRKGSFVRFGSSPNLKYFHGDDHRYWISAEMDPNVPGRGNLGPLRIVLRGRFTNSLPGSGRKGAKGHARIMYREGNHWTDMAFGSHTQACVEGCSVAIPQ